VIEEEARRRGTEVGAERVELEILDGAPSLIPLRTSAARMRVWS